MGLTYEELDNVPSNTEVIPESCLSFMEQAMYVVEFAANESTNMTTTLGIWELREYQRTGEEVEYVGENVEVLEEAVKEKIKKVFGAIKGSIDKIDTYFASATKKGKSLVGNIDKSALDKCPDTLGKTHTFFDYNKIDFANKALSLMKKVVAWFDSHSDLSEEEYKKYVNEVYSSMYKDITGISADSDKQFKKLIREELIGQEITADKAFVTKHFDQMKEVVAGDMIPNNIKKFYKDQLKSAADYYDMIEKKNEGKPRTKAFMYEEDILSQILVTAYYGNMAAFDVYKRMYQEYFAILYKVSKYARGKKPLVEESVSVVEEKKDVAKEEVTPEDLEDDEPEVNLDESFSKQYNMIDTAFDF